MIMNEQVKKYCSIGTDNIVVYDFYPRKKGSKTVSHKSKENLTKKYTSTCLTKQSAKKIKKILTHWILAINLSQKKQKATGRRKRRYLVMCTLTLPSEQVENDKMIKRMYLNNFLIQLKKKYHDINYLWVAEKQKNGNIHFHLIVDRWLSQIWVQNTWNRNLSHGSYIKAFAKKHGHENPPSSHLCGQKKMGNPANYLTKYVTKSTDSKAIDGVKWACSKELQEIIKIKFLCKDWYRDFLYYYRDVLKVKYFENDYVQVFYFTDNFLNDFMYHDLFLDNEHQFLKTYSLIYPELTPPQTIKVVPTQLKQLPPEQLRFELGINGTALLH